MWRHPSCIYPSTIGKAKGCHLKWGCRDVMPIPPPPPAHQEHCKTQWLLCIFSLCWLFCCHRFENLCVEPHGLTWRIRSCGGGHWWSHSAPLSPSQFCPPHCLLLPWLSIPLASVKLTSGQRGIRSSWCRSQNYLSRPSACGKSLLSMVEVPYGTYWTGTGGMDLPPALGLIGSCPWSAILHFKAAWAERRPHPGSFLNPHS